MNKIPSTEIHTEGGTAVIGNVTISDGDFIGRDKNIFITSEVAYDVRGLPNPYLGLRSYSYAERELYTGRDDEIKESIKGLTSPGEQQTILFITGASGCGKSSFVQAGILPELEKYYAQRHCSLAHAVFRPSAHPLAMLKDALLQLGIESLTLPAPLTSSVQPKQISLLVIDQFEEAFTQSDQTERAELFQWLSRLPPFTQISLYVLITIRSDFLNELAEVPSLWVQAKNAIMLRAMSIEALKATIQRPLQTRFPTSEKRFEPELVEKLAMDAANDPTLLPLLQVTLEEIWRKGKLMRSAYDHLTDALKQRADQVIEFEDYNASNPQKRRSAAKQHAIFTILLDLIKVSLDEDSQQDVRVSRSVEILYHAQGNTVTTAEQKLLVADLVDARLLSIVSESGSETANIIHEALIRNWTRLQIAIAERRQELQQRTRFEQAVHQWLSHQRSNEYLLQGIYLAEARKLAQQEDIALRNNLDAQDLLSSSIEQAESQQRAKLARAEAQIQAEQQTVVRTRLLLLVAIALVAVLGVPVLYRMILRWNAMRSVPLVAIPVSTVVLGHTPERIEFASNYLPLQEYDVSAFQIEKYEVTNERYNLCVNANACSPPNAPRIEYAAQSRSNFPVVNITALQASQFCHWLGRRLPTEFEWERTARYTDQRLWPWTHATVPIVEISRFANFQTSSEYGALLPVGSYPLGKSLEGVEDLAGNVWEWTQSSFDSLPETAEIGRRLIDSEITTETLSVRGGGADIPADIMENLISARMGTLATKPGDYIGFRCVAN